MTSLIIPPMPAIHVSNVRFLRKWAASIGEISTRGWQFNDSTIFRIILFAFGAWKTRHIVARLVRMKKPM